LFGVISQWPWTTKHEANITVRMEDDGITFPQAIGLWNHKV